MSAPSTFQDPFPIDAVALLIAYVLRHFKILELSAMAKHRGIGNPNTMYEYETFRDPAGQIRIATIQPGQECDSISCTLEICDLNNVPRFEALSYACGKEENLQPIKLQGADWDVTPTLHAALLALRNRWEPRRLWIDAICINQRNNDERRPQVSLIAQIYHNAVQVVAWLGEEIENFEGASHLMKILPKILPSTRPLAKFL